MTNLRDLLKENSVQVGDNLIWVRKQSGQTHRAQLMSNGKIQTEDGQVHNSPSSAAKHCNGGVAVNGWRVWKVERLKMNLLNLREELLGRKSQVK